VEIRTALQDRGRLRVQVHRTQQHAHRRRAKRDATPQAGLTIRPDTVGAAPAEIVFLIVKWLPP